MRILLAMRTLDYSGVPTYVLTLTRELLRRGHHMAVYCPPSRIRVGRPMEPFLPMVADMSKLSIPDVMIAYHTACAGPLRQRFPQTPLLFSAHGVPPRIGAEPPEGVHVDRYLAINEQVVARLTSCGIAADQIDLVRDFVETDTTFRPLAPLQERPRVLFLSNYKKWRNYFMVVDACTSLGLDWRAVGGPYGRSAHVEEDINKADLVISWGRGILEAMACGRAVISFDQIKMRPEDMYSTVAGDGYLTEARYLESRQHNFGPLGCRITFTRWQQLAAEIAQYHPSHGLINRRLALASHGQADGVDRVLASTARAQESRACARAPNFAAGQVC